MSADSSSSPRSLASDALKLGIIERREKRWAQAALWLRMALEEGVDPEQEVNIRCLLCDTLLEMDVEHLDEALDHAEMALLRDRALKKPRFLELRYRALLFPRVDLWWASVPLIQDQSPREARAYLIERLELTSYIPGKHLPHVSRQIAELSMSLRDAELAREYCYHTLEAEIPYRDPSQAPASYEGAREGAEDILDMLSGR